MLSNKKSMSKVPKQITKVSIQLHIEDIEGFSDYLIPKNRLYTVNNKKYPQYPRYALSSIWDLKPVCMCVYVCIYINININTIFPHFCSLEIIPFT